LLLLACFCLLALLFLAVACCCLLLPAFGCLCLLLLAVACIGLLCLLSLAFACFCLVLPACAGKAPRLRYHGRLATTSDPGNRLWYLRLWYQGWLATSISGKRLRYLRLRSQGRLATMSNPGTWLGRRAGTMRAPRTKTANPRYQL
jgi:hypothetical protein